MNLRGCTELGLFFLIVSIGRCLPYFITVDAHAEECFFDKVQNGTKMGTESEQSLIIVPSEPVLRILIHETGLTFEVIEGGFLDIDVRVQGPDNEEIIKRERESNGKVTFAAARTGTYTYCFSNKMSTMTPKGVMFSMEIGEPQHATNQEGESEYFFACPNVVFVLIRLNQAVRQDVLLFFSVKYHA